MKYMHRLTHHVEQKIANELPSKVAIIFYGWTLGGTKYLGLFASFPTLNKIG